MLLSNMLQLPTVPRSREFDELGRCTQWSFRLDWRHGSNLSIVNITNHQDLEYFGLLLCDIEFLRTAKIISCGRP